MRKRIDFGYMHQNPPSDVFFLDGRECYLGDDGRQGAVPNVWGT